MNEQMGQPQKTMSSREGIKTEHACYSVDWCWDWWRRRSRRRLEPYKGRRRLSNAREDCSVVLSGFYHHWRQFVS